MKKLFGLLLLFFSLSVCAQKHRVVVYGKRMLPYPLTPKKELKTLPRTVIRTKHNQKVVANIKQIIAHKDTVPSPPAELLANLRYNFLIEFKSHDTINELIVLNPGAFSYNNKFYELDSTMVDEIRKLFPEAKREQYTPLKFQKQYVSSLAATTNPIILVYEVPSMADYRIPMTAERIIKHPSYLRAITDTRKIKEITQDITKAKAANMNYKSFQVCGAAIIRQQNQIDTLQIELIAGKYSLFRGRVARLSKKTAVLLGININSPYLFNRKISRRWGRFWTTSSRNSPPAAE